MSPLYRGPSLPSRWAIDAHSLQLSASGAGRVSPRPERQALEPGLGLCQMGGAEVVF